jgi:hypothetical protein
MAKEFEDARRRGVVSARAAGLAGRAPEDDEIVVLLQRSLETIRAD